MPRDYSPETTHPSIPTISVARALVLTPDFESMLLCQRENGEWELPGGKCDAGETLVAACLREVYEETSTIIRVGGVPKEHERRIFPSGGSHCCYVAHVVLGVMVQGPGKPVPKLGEARDARWLPFDQAARIIAQEQLSFRENTATALEALRNSILSSYGVLVGDNVQRLAGVIRMCEVPRPSDYETSSAA